MAAFDTTDEDVASVVAAVKHAAARAGAKTAD
jgi:hypothetical protein